MKKILRLSLYASAFLVTFVSSEAIYQLNHPDIFLTNYIFERARTSINEGNFDKGLTTLNFGANLLINKNKKTYPNVISKTNSLKISLPDNTNLRQEVQKYITSLKNFKDLSKSGKYDYSRIYYDLAILAYKNKEEKLFTDFLEASHYLAPDLSYWTVELANYYYSIDQENPASEILTKCLTIEAPKKHCQKYIDYFSSQSPFYEPGFLSNEAEEYYKYPSVAIKM